jgi:hypothetical protein
VLPSDDQNEPPNLGYRVMWLSGARPRSAGAFLDRSWPLSQASQRGAGAGQLSLELSYSDVADLDAEIALVAIDRAGNESEPSEPIHLQWSGCTRDGDECLEDAGCSASRPARGSVGWVVAVALGLAAIRRRSQRRA